ncbi:MAG: beta-ketoacyl synthase N-terminal-like domain-containing protein [Planctomycetia bacterium]|nr:beta-ketoacyl synthase N-terminal-like domain-containing protein [Planctomycetia bacterium]
MNNKILITGLGLVSPLGDSKEELWNHLSTGKSGIVPLDGEDYGLKSLRFGAPCSFFTGEIGDFGELHKEVKKNIRKNAKVMCRETQMAVAAAQKALHDAGLAYDGCPQGDTGVMFGTDHMVADPRAMAPAFLACMENGVLHTEFLGSKGIPQVMPLWLLIWLTNMPGCHISIYNQLLGPNNSITMGEASANAALKYAQSTIHRGAARRMVVGVTGTRLQAVRTWQTAISEKLADENCVPEEACRPFDKNHTGQVLGEGAGVFILESQESALARGAKIYAEFIAAADSMAGTHTEDLSRRCLVPDFRQSMENVLRGVLDRSGYSVDEIGFIHAHGVGVPEIDRAEADAIHAVFGARREPIPVVAAKSYSGNLGAGSGALEIMAGIAALESGHLFPTKNFVESDGYKLNIVMNENVPAGKCFINLNVNSRGQASAALLAHAE